MATMNTGLGGPAGYGENVFSAANGTSGDDDTSVAIDVTSVFGSGGLNFYGTSYTSINLNSNGTISFGSAFTSTQTNDFTATTTPLLAPFWSDVNIDAGGEIYWDVDPTAGTVTMTWLDVAPYNGSGTNSFQVVLTDNGGGDFTVEYIYEDIQWSGSGSDQADVGWTDGGSNDVILDGSTNSTELLNYETNDFGNGDPVGTYTQSFTGGTPVNAPVGDGTVTGTAGGDVIDGSYTDAEGDSVGTGDDLVYGGDGNDTITAGDGNDTIFGERGNDSVFGGIGDDRVFGGQGSDSIDAGDGADTIFGGSSNDTIDADSGDDVVFGGSGADSIDGGAGSDFIRAGSGDDVISDTGGTGSNDTIFGEAGDDSIYAGQGSDIVTGGAGADTIDGGAGADTIEGNDGNDSIVGGDGNDVLIGDTNDVAVTGAESLNWTAEGPGGTDLQGAFSQDTGGMTVSVEVTNDGNANNMSVSTGTTYTETGEPFSANSTLQLGGGAGATSTTLFNFNPNLDSGLADEVENVTFRINDIDDNSWLDIVTVNAYDANGNPVAVTITPATTGTATSDTVSGNTITAGNQADGQADAAGSALIQIAGPVHEIEVIYENGDTGGQALWITDIHFDTTAADPANAGNDTIDGGAGDDYIEGNEGDDSVSGGSGNDTVYLGDGNDEFGDWSTDDGNDTIFGGAGDDRINGGNDDDTLYGGAGDDTLIGASGNDTAFGGDGSDEFQVTDDHENDIIVGGEDGDGSDVDIVNFSNFESTDGVTVTATGDEAGTYDFDGTIGDGSYTEIEGLNGTQYDDTFNIRADNSGTSIEAGAGDDVITTGSGDDVVDGGQGADTFNTGAGNDQINLGEDSPGTPDQDPDVIILQDGFGDDIVTNFDAPTPDGDGTFTGIDTLDVTNLLDAGGDPVNVFDVTVTDDGSGNAVLTFPNAESITLIGIDPATADDPQWLIAAGIPAPDGTVEGTSGADTIGSTYTGDPDGDMVDNNDAILPGDSGDDDLIYAYGGDDSIYAGSGNDEAYGGAGDDLVQDGTGNSTLFGGTGDDTIYAGSGNDTLVGGDDDDVLGGGIGSDTSFGGAGNDSITAGGFAGTGDTMDGGTGDDTLTGGLGDDTMLGGTGDDQFNVSSNGGTDTITGGEDADGLDVDTLTFTDNNGPEGVDVTMTGDEAGSYDFDGETGNGDFSEIETFELTDQDDSFDGTAATGGNTVSGNAGDDVLVGSSGSDSFDGGADNDVISGGGGTDTIEGGDGDDVISGDASAPTAGASQGDAGQLVLNGNNVRTGSETGTPGDAQVGDSIIFDNAGTLPDGTVISAQVTVVSISDPDVTVDLNEGSDPAAPLRVSGNGDPSNAGAQVQFRVEFFDQVTGEPITIDGQATVTDIDDNAGAGEEFVSFSDADVSEYTVASGSSVTPAVGGGTVTGTGTTTNTSSEETAWFGVGFENLSELNMTVGVVENTANYGFSGQDIPGGITTAVDGGEDDSLSGGAGNDTIFGNGGNDIIDGGADDDELFGGSGQDTLFGGDGNDTITGGADEDAIYGGPGDIVDGSEDGVDNDTLYVSGAINIIYDVGNPENGIVQFASGPDLVFSNIENVVILNDGTVSGTAGDDLIDSSYTGDPDGDQIDSGDALIPGHNPNDDFIEAGAGNDEIDASIGSDTVYAGTGDDLIYAGADSSADTVFGEAGNDTMFGFDGDDELYGGADNDTLDGDGGNDTLDGGSGNDQLIGDAGTDTMFGGDGADTFFGGADNDTIDGGTGNDAAFGGSGDDTIDGGQSADTLYGGTGDDTQFGGDGDDVFVLEENFGNDTITGGETGETVGDTLDASGVTSDLTVDLETLLPGNPETGTISDGVDTAFFQEIENITLGSGDDSVTGSSGDESVDLGSGADTFDGGVGDDRVDLGSNGAGSPDGDADVIILQDGFGNDTVANFDAPTPDGDGTFTGIDTLDVTNLNDANGDPVHTGDVTVTDDGSGNALLTFPNGESIVLEGIDPVAADDPFYLNAIGIPMPDGTVSGTAGADTIDNTYIGDPDGDRVDANDAILPGDTGDDDLIEGNGGDDSISAGAGDDEVYGGADDDRLDGGVGSDTLIGDAGDDTLLGGLDDDALFGGTGDDTVALDELTGTDVIEGGEDLSGTDIDTLNFEPTNVGGVDVTFTGAEEGTYSVNSGASDGTFAEFEAISGSDQDDTVDATLNTSDLTVSGNAGDDTITGGLGDDVLSGGDDRDTFFAQDNFGNDTVTGGQGGDNYDTLDLSNVTNPVTVAFTGPGAGTVTDTVTGDVITFSEIEQLILTNQADVVDASGDNGYTYIQTLEGNDSVLGSEGDDVYDDETGVGTDGAGNDTFFGGAGNDEIWAGDDDDTLFGGTGADTLQGQAGNDSLYGGANADTLDGGTGDDLVDGGQSNDELIGDAGNDTLFGGTAFDTLYGGDDNDTLDGGIANDTIDGGSGDDTIIVNDNFADDSFVQDEIITGSETGETNGDTLDGSGLTQDVVVTMTGDEAGTITNGTGTATFSEIEQIETGSGDDTFVGGVGADTITTNAGDDDITISDGDSVSAGFGDDVITLADTSGGPGTTINIDGGSGDETAGVGGGDTLQLGDLANLQDVLDNAVDDGTGSFSGSITLDDGTILNFSEIENIICFTPQTRIATPKGLVEIKDLKVGDLVVTRDHGLQPIRWIEARSVPAVDRFAPVTIGKNVLSGQDRDLIVSPQHRVLFQGYRAELLFGESEVLVAAKHLVDGIDVTQDQSEMVTYIHMLFDQHEIVYAEGAATESFHPGDIGFSAVGDEAREELFAIFPELRVDPRQYGATARRCLKGHEAKLIRL